jgi:FMN-dependent NADH-azoreductase
VALLTCGSAVASSIVPTLLHLDSSADLAHSRSRALTAHFADAWRAAGPNHLVIRRDLHRDALPHVPVASMHWPAGDRPEGPAPSVEAETLQREIIEELLAADVLLVGAPLYNYSVPSTLKAWLDYVHIPGVTTGSVHPLAGRPAVVVATQGAVYDAGTPREGWDHGVPLLELLLGTAFAMDVTVVKAQATLADRAADLAEYRERGEADYAAAVETLAALAAKLA